MSVERDCFCSLYLPNDRTALICSNVPNVRTYADARHAIFLPHGRSWVITCAERV